MHRPMLRALKLNDDEISLADVVSDASPDVEGIETPLAWHTRQSMQLVPSRFLLGYWSDVSPDIEGI